MRDFRRREILVSSLPGHWRAPPKCSMLSSGGEVIDRVLIYQLNVRNFTSSGTFSEAIVYLPHIRSLGVTHIQLLPIHPIGSVGRIGKLGSPYAVSDYKAINSEFGGRADFARFVTESHKIGLGVIMDWVANHSALDNEWVKSHPEWYKRGSNGEIAINPHGWPDVAELNYSDPHLRQIMKSAMGWWIETFDIDGFRCDVAGLVPMDFWEETVAQLRKRKPELFLVAESDNINFIRIGFDAVYDWTFKNLVSKLATDSFTADNLIYWLSVSGSLSAGRSRLRFTSNHDINAMQYGDVGVYATNQNARFALILCLLLSPTALIFQGQEYGGRWQSLVERTPLDRSVDTDLMPFELASRVSVNPGVDGLGFRRIDRDLLALNCRLVGGKDSGEVFVNFSATDRRVVLENGEYLRIKGRDVVLQMNS